MSELQVVEHEVLVPLNVQDAERLDRRIRLMAQTTRENFEKVGRLLDEAKNGRLHEALGFKSWTAYVADALGGQLQLSGEARQAMVQVLAGEGMSVRAIATATGVSKSTVDRDLAQVSHDGTPVSADVSESGVPQRDTSEVVDALADGDAALADELSAALQDSEPATVTGIDGKTYTKPKRKPKRKPVESEPTPDPEPVKAERKVQIPTAYRDTVRAIRPLVDDLLAFTRDPRWDKARGRFTHGDRAALDAQIELLTAIRSALESTPTIEEKSA